MSKKAESPTTKFKKSTAKFVRGEFKKTQHSFSHVRSFAMEILVTVAVALGVSFGYVYLIQ